MDRSILGLAITHGVRKVFSGPSRAGKHIDDSLASNRTADASSKSEKSNVDFH